MKINRGEKLLKKQINKQKDGEKQVKKLLKKQINKQKDGQKQVEKVNERYNK